MIGGRLTAVPLMESPYRYQTLFKHGATFTISVADWLKKRILTRKQEQYGDIIIYLALVLFFGQLIVRIDLFGHFNL